MKFKIFLLLTTIIGISAQNVSAINTDELIKKTPYIVGIITTGAIAMYATKQLFELCKSLKKHQDLAAILSVFGSVGILGISAIVISDLATRA